MGARRWWILVALMVAVLPLVLDLGFVLATIPTLPGGALTAAVLPATLAAALPLMHRLDRLRPALIAGLVVCLLATIGEAMARGAAEVTVARAVVGVGAAAALPAALRVLKAAFEPAEQLRALSIWAGFTGLALALAPLLGGLLVDAHGWPSVFVVEVPFFAVGLASIGYLLPTLTSPKLLAGGGFGLRGPAAILLMTVASVALERRLDWSRAAVGGVILALFTAFSTASRGVAPAMRRWGAERVVAAGVAVMVLGGTGLALTSGSLLVVPLAVGAALVLGAAPVSGAVLRIAALAGGFALGAAQPTTALLVGSALLVGAGLLGGARRRSSDLTPP